MMVWDDVKSFVDLFALHSEDHWVGSFIQAWAGLEWWYLRFLVVCQVHGNLYGGTHGHGHVHVQRYVFTFCRFRHSWQIQPFVFVCYCVDNDELVCRQRNIGTVATIWSEPSCDMFLSFVVNLAYCNCLCCSFTARSTVRCVFVFCFHRGKHPWALQYVLMLFRSLQVQRSVFTLVLLSSSSTRHTKMCVFVVLCRRRYIGTSAARTSKQYILCHLLLQRHKA